MVVVADYVFYTVIAVLVFGSKIINSQGGFKIVLWRVRGVSWFLHTRIGPDQNVIRKPLKMKIVKSHSVPMYECDGKEWLTGGPDETARIFGGPQWVYRYNDARPLPLKQIETKMVEVEVTIKNADGTEKIEKMKKPVVVAGKPIDPMLIHAGFENKSIEAFNHLSDKPNKIKWGLLGFAIMVILIVSIFTMIYTYYYGVNIACAVHAHGVACG